MTLEQYTALSPEDKIVALRKMLNGEDKFDKKEVYDLEDLMKNIGLKD